ncbi:hypothetical protein FEF65_02720 [Mariprofundus erugo]|uniref:Uncharacterized protein n=1 Tax=Mariprofundus erugo TaxID=2528639 RepID=A0A5R9GQU2_9PROT|nr:hypothetical protein [Mariprofundus erugo]TLS68636.1 hypothetical protein FEF65_02720 [Mariprofundus erugo]
MGGFGSGRNGGRLKTEAQKRIEIMWMHRQGLLHNGSSGVINWSLRGERVASIGYHVQQHSLLLNYRHQAYGEDWQDVKQIIQLEYTPCNYGGRRVWMRCPHCCRRCAILYIVSKYPACRKCYNLAYASESEGQLDRVLRKARDAQEKLGKPDGKLMGWLPRPKGMNMKTYLRLLKHLERGKAMFNTEVIRRFNLLGEEPPFL